MARPVLTMNARERRLLSLLGAGAAALLVLAVPFGVEAVVHSAHSDNDELRQALADVQDARGRVKERQARKEAISVRYAHRAPSLAGYLEQAARQQKLEITEATPQPDVPHGKRYVEHATNVHLKKTGMLPLARFLESLEKSSYPVAVTRLDLRKRSGEPDSYDVEVGVSAYDRNEVPETAPAGSAQP
jgi:general secretion pathway protein M